MAIIVCCPCGNPLDCDNLDLVITVTCPQCRRELTLELEGVTAGRRALLTVMEGPHWVGERFVVPVGVDLSIGQTGGNWLSLDSDKVSPVHCRIQLGADGSVIVEDRQSTSGTWIGDLRIARGKLPPKGSLRVGEFRLRLDYESADGTTIVAATPGSANDQSGILPTMTRVRGRRTPGAWAVSNRFKLSRWMLMLFAWLAGAFHGIELIRANGWLRWQGLVAGVVILAAISMSGRRVTLSHKHFKYASLLLLIVLALVDLNWGLPVGAISCLGMAACVLMLVLRTPSELTALGAALLGTFALCVLATGLWQGASVLIEGAWSRP